MSYTPNLKYLPLFLKCNASYFLLSKFKDRKIEVEEEKEKFLIGSFDNHLKNIDSHMLKNYYVLPGIDVDLTFELSVKSLISETITNEEFYLDVFLFNDFYKKEDFPIEIFLYLAFQYLLSLNVEKQLREPYLIINFHFLQPYISEYVQVETYNVEQVRKEYEKIKTQLESLALNFKTGEHCKSCLATSICPALAKDVALIQEEYHYKTPKTLENEEIGDKFTSLKSTLKKVEAETTAIEQEITTRLRRQERVRGYALRYRGGRTVWNVDSVLQVVKTAKNLGIALEKPKEYITPRQAIIAGLDADLVKKHSVIQPGSYHLEKENQKDIQKIFKKTFDT